MIKELAESKGSILAFEVTGKVTEEEEKAWLERFDNVLKEHDKVSVMVILGENVSWGTHAGYEDVKWLLKHMNRFDKIAFVTDSTKYGNGSSLLIVLLQNLWVSEKNILNPQK